MKKLLALLFFISTYNGFAQNFTFFKDINQTPNDAFSSVNQSINYNGELYFFLKSQTYGNELWKTDGTVAGTILVKDIIPGAESGNTAVLITVFNNLLFFTYQTPQNGVELWQTDGTAAGTRLFFDFFPGPGSGFSKSQVVTSNLPTPTMYLCARDSAYTFSLYRYTPLSRTPQKFYSYTYANSTYSSDMLINSLHVLGSKLLFFQYEPGSYQGMEPWVSNGTAQGTALLKNINTQAGNGSGSQSISSSPLSFFFGNINGFSFFNAKDSANGTELWCTDGTTAGTSLVKDISPGIGGSLNNPTIGLKIPNGNLLFCAYTTTEGLEPWITDGTTAGTRLIKDIALGNYSSNVNINNTAIFSGLTLFMATDTALGNNPYLTNGTDTGTYLLQDIFPFGNVVNTGFTFLKTQLPNGVLFTGRDSSQNAYLYITDGTVSGTSIVATYYPQNINGNLYRPGVQAIGFVNNKLIFSTWLTFQSYTTYKYYITDGTTLGTVPIDFNSALTENLSSNPFNFTKYNGEWFFAANNGINGTQMWKTDGSVGGTYMFKNLARSPLNINSISNLCLFNEINGSLYFVGSNSQGKFIKYTGGSSANFSLAENNPTGSVNSPVYKVGQQLFFSRDKPVNGYEPWRFNGTTATMMEINIANNCNTNNISLCSGNANVTISKPNFVIFTARDEYGSGNLYRYSGGTFCAKIAEPYQAADFFLADTSTYFYYGSTRIYKSSIMYGPGGLVDVSGVFDSVVHAVAYNNTDFYFAAKSGSSGYQLWRSGGTVATTSLVKIINPSGNAFENLISSGNSYHTAGMFLNNNFYFYANDGVHGFELWKSDGTTNGTSMVKDINLTSGSKTNFNDHTWGYTELFVKAGNKLYFIADDGVHGYEVWVTDGTTAGTHIASDINPTGNAFPVTSPYSSSYNYCSLIPFSISDSILVFNAFNGNATESYYINNATGTAHLFDINKSYPDNFYNANRLYSLDGKTTIPELNLITAFSPQKGFELYKYSTTTPPNPNLTCAFNSSCTGDSITIFHNFPSKPGIGNISTLQMSDSSGSFASPVNIATFTSTNATQNYAIPTGTIPGLHYRFRITTSVPPAILPDNGADVVISSKPQIMNCVDSIFVSAQPSLCGANVNYNFNAVGSPQGESDYSIAPNSFFPVGTTPVYFTAWNGCGYDTCHFVVVVVDSVSPQIVCPADITTATSTVTYTAAATDNCGIPTVTFNPPSGTSFPLGTTLVTATATDSSGNNSTCQFAVTITTLRVAGENNNALNNDQFTISPVPVNEQMVIDLDLSLKGSINISIKDITGFTRFSKDVMCIEGNNSLKINTHDLVNGVYAVELTGNNIHTVQKVVVKK